MSLRSPAWKDGFFTTSATRETQVLRFSRKIKQGIVIWSDWEVSLTGQWDQRFLNFSSCGSRTRTEDSSRKVRDSGDWEGQDDLVTLSQQIHLILKWLLLALYREHRELTWLLPQLLTLVQLCDPMHCSPPGSSVHELLQARILSGLPRPSPGDLPNQGIEPRSPILQADPLPSEPPGKTPSYLLPVSSTQRFPPSPFYCRAEIQDSSPPFYTVLVVVCKICFLCLFIIILKALHELMFSWITHFKSSVSLPVFIYMNVCK